MTTYYKFLKKDHKGEYNGFDYTAYLPKRGKPGKWLPKIDGIEMCASGYHVCLKKNLSEWMNDDLYIVEIRGEKIEDDAKIVSQEMRFVKHVMEWNEKNLHLAAADIIRQIALPVWKKDHPDDISMENVIDIVIRYANGKATSDELAAAWATAWAAAWDAARDAAWAAVWVAAWATARDAAKAAVWAAAWAAARDAARDAAWDDAIRIIYKHCGV